jgi:hypothetical protein
LLKKDSKFKELVEAAENLKINVVDLSIQIDIDYPTT